MCVPFRGFISIIAIIALVSGIIIDPIWWVVLRAVTGFSTAGTSMIIESWLNERASNESRGAIFSLYIGITLLGVVGGQMMIPLEDVRTPVLFMICGIFYCIAMLPTTLSTAASPQPLKAGAASTCRRSIATRRSPASASCSSASPTAPTARSAPSSAPAPACPTPTSPS